jgi:hypothetical protein
MQHVITFALLLMWVAGIVLAEGFWFTILSIIVPFYSWYLVVEQAVLKWLL